MYMNLKYVNEIIGMIMVLENAVHLHVLTHIHSTRTFVNCNISIEHLVIALDIMTLT